MEKVRQIYERNFITLHYRKLETSLDTDKKKLAFWINIYNAYIQEILSKSPEKYQDRSNFFKAEQIPIAEEWFRLKKLSTVS
ncbi:DUF547 domain-containing protein [Winogradskyella maritima]|nr:DUF547 domain-containing protein [Winogradskyella maritima]